MARGDAGRSTVKVATIRAKKERPNPLSGFGRYLAKCQRAIIDLRRGSPIPVPTQLSYHQW